MDKQSIATGFLGISAARRQRIVHVFQQIILRPYVCRKWAISCYLKNPIDVIVYFSDPPSNLYQIREWYAPLAALNSELTVTIISCHAASFIALQRESPVPVLFQPNFDAYERIFEACRPALILYVNHNVQNLASMQWGDALTVFIGHGESEKPYMTWGQIRAYDFHLVAGQAAIQRLSKRLPNYNIKTRALVIGRPQCDGLLKEPDSRSEPSTVLYCPTRESDRASMALSSVLPVGLEVVEILLSLGYRIIYRPHPCLGRDSTPYAKASQAIISRLHSQNCTIPNIQNHHIVDRTPDIGWQINASSFCISDISAFGLDYLASAKPLIVLLPNNFDSEQLSATYFSASYLTRFDQINLLPQKIDLITKEDPMRTQRVHCASYYFDGLSQRQSTSRFITTIKYLITYQRDEMRRLATLAGITSAGCCARVDH